MVRVWIIFCLLPILVSCSGDGNIRLLEEDIAEALQVCSKINNNDHKKNVESRQKRNDKLRDEKVPRIDANTKEEVNPYSHTRRSTNTLYLSNSFNGSIYNNTSDKVGSKEKKFINSASHQVKRNNNVSSSFHNDSRTQRVKRDELLVNRNDSDQCLSQCVFANLQMVDSKGIPREAVVWNKVYTSVTSQQSRMIVRDQIRACFQELQSESEEDECSYSNKLERCLMLRFSDRKINNETTDNL